MRKHVGSWVLASGALLVVLGLVYRNNGGLTAGADLITGNGAVLALFGASLIAAGRRARLGGEPEWRNRALGAALAVSLSAVWRGAVEIMLGTGSGFATGLGITLATLGLLLPAMFCWGYVATTFLPWSAPRPMELNRKAETRTRAA